MWCCIRNILCGVAFTMSQYVNDCFQCSSYGFNSHARLIWFIYHLRWQVWNVHKTSLDIALLCCIVTYAVHQVIAYKCTSRVRNLGRNACLMQCIDDIFNRQCSKVCARAIGYDWFILWLIARIVWTTEIVAINSNTFYRDICTTASLANT